MYVTVGDYLQQGNCYSCKTPFSLCFAFIFVAVLVPPAAALNHGSLNRLL